MAGPETTPAARDITVDVAAAGSPAKAGNPFMGTLPMPAPQISTPTCTPTCTPTRAPRPRQPARTRRCRYGAVARAWDFRRSREGWG